MFKGVININPKFNDAQIEAIEHFRGPALVLAGPGSGKTTVITHRIKNLIEKCNINPDAILVITFTKMAAQEMLDRFLKLTKNQYMEVTFGTFHSIFFKILKYSYDLNQSNLITENEKYEIIREIISNFDIQTNDENNLISKIISEIGKVKNSKIKIDGYIAHSIKSEYFCDIYNQYSNHLERNGKLDFDDMLTMCYELFLSDKKTLHLWQEKYKYVLIDECQDINPVQADTMLMLCQNEMNLFMVGDDDQSIYGFRGSSPQIMKDMQEKYNFKLIKLSINYRSTSNIVNAAGQVIENNKIRFNKDITTFNEPGERVLIKEFPNVNEENDYIIKSVLKLLSENVDPNQISILVRTNATGSSIIAKLSEYNISFRTREGFKNIYAHWACRDLFAYINIANGSCLRKDYLRIINKPQRFISRNSMPNEYVDFNDITEFYKDKTWIYQRVKQLKEDLDFLKNKTPFAALNYIRKAIGYDKYIKDYCDSKGISYEPIIEILDEVQNASSNFTDFYGWKNHINEFSRLLNTKAFNQQQNGINVATLHACKGLEFEHVFILDVNEGVIPYNKAVFESEIEEERRMFYVAMTRAKTNLVITFTDRRFNKQLPMSRFIRNIEDNAIYDFVTKEE